jgi:septal ring factor EnvC (AmiA/AmiB activator)
MSLVSAGDWRSALDQFQAAYEQRADAALRSRFNDLAHLLAAQVSVRTWRDAEASLHGLSAEARASARTTALLRRINDEDAGSPASILDTGEQLAIVLADAD